MILDNLCLDIPLAPSWPMVPRKTATALPVVLKSTPLHPTDLSAAILQEGQTLAGMQIVADKIMQRDRAVLIPPPPAPKVSKAMAALRAALDKTGKTAAMTTQVIADANKPFANLDMATLKKMLAIDRSSYRDFAQHYIGHYSGKSMRDYDYRSRARRTEAMYENQIKRLLPQGRPYWAYLPDTPPNVEEVDRLASFFIWGPRGEWTGLFTPPGEILKDCRDYNDFYEIGEAFGLDDRTYIYEQKSGHYHEHNPFQIGGRDDFVPPYAETTYSRAPDHYRFVDYEAWERADRRLTTIEARQNWHAHKVDMRIFGLFRSLRPDMALVNDWIAHLETGPKFGFGVLRDAKDRYDPIGVLAMVNQVQWTWNQDEGAWSTFGSCYTVPAPIFGEWLGVEKASRYGIDPADARLTKLMQLVTEIADGATSFKPVIQALREAQTAATIQQGRYDAFRAMLKERDLDKGGYDRYGDLLGLERTRRGHHHIYDLDDGWSDRKIAMEYVSKTGGVSTSGYTDMEEDILDPEIFDEA
uniref:Terminase large subunit n=1 Tax=Caulobacter phage BL57 TaxID=3348355 RepID=A0AB74UNG2_9VIRU